MKAFQSISAIAIAAAFSPAVLATVTITSNNSGSVATFTNTAPTSATFTGGTSHGACNLTADTTAQDQVYANSWHWRLNGIDTREFAFSSAAGFGFAENSAGNTATRSWTGLDGGRFNATLSFTLVDGAVAGQATLTQTMTITNTSANALDLALFNYGDFDVNNSSGTDVATSLASDIMQITDVSTVQWQGAGASAYQVTAYSTLSGLLTDAAINNLNNTGLPFPSGDFTGAWQWNQSIAVGGSYSVTSTIAVNTAVPAPGALALLGLAGVAGGRRRRA